ncbi:unnamed protein product, partial [Allacma fusca]
MGSSLDGEKVSGSHSLTPYFMLEVEGNRKRPGTRFTNRGQGSNLCRLNLLISHIQRFMRWVNWYSNKAKTFTTIEWLKESVKELRHGIQEVSASVNVTGLVHLRQHWDTEVNRLDGDLRTSRNDVESLKASQARDEEGLLEIKGDIADLRTWQIKMGQKFLQEEQTQVISEASE